MVLTTQLRPRESVGNSGSPCDGLGVSDDARFVTKCCEQCEQMAWKQRLEVVSFRFGFLNVGEGIESDRYRMKELVPQHHIAVSTSCLLITHVSPLSGSLSPFNKVKLKVSYVIFIQS